MHGPSLTPQEAVASVAQRVRRREAEGFDRDRAIERVAVETGVDPQKVRWCVEAARPDAIRSSTSGRRRRILAIAAAL
jgi:hypothetical protein